MQLTKKLLALVHLASTDVSRYNICGIFFSADGSSIATDGNVLGRIVPSDIEPRKATFTLALDSVKDLIRRVGKKGSTVELDVGDKGLRGIMDAEHRNTYELVEGDFPDWKNIHKRPSKSDTQYSVCLSVHVLEALVAASRQFTGTKRGDIHLVEFTFKGELKPVFAEVKDKDTSDVLEMSLMPMRKA